MFLPLEQSIVMIWFDLIWFLNISINRYTPNHLSEQFGNLIDMLHWDLRNKSVYRREMYQTMSSILCMHIYSVAIVITEFWKHTDNVLMCFNAHCVTEASPTKEIFFAGLTSASWDWENAPHKKFGAENYLYYSGNDHHQQDCTGGWRWGKSKNNWKARCLI